MIFQSKLNLWHPCVVLVWENLYNAKVQRRQNMKFEVSNYRPVSLLPFLSKALDRAILIQFSSYLYHILCHHPSRPFCCIWHSESPHPYFLHSGSGCLRLCSLPALVLPQRPQLPGNLERICIPSLSSHYWGVPSSFVCKPSLSALPFTYMVFPTTAMLMTPN